jgi:hypothetical protein
MTTEYYNIIDPFASTWQQYINELFRNLSYFCSSDNSAEQSTTDDNVSIVMS